MSNKFNGIKVNIGTYNGHCSRVIEELLKTSSQGFISEEKYLEFKRQCDNYLYISNDMTIEYKKLFTARENFIREVFTNRSRFVKGASDENNLFLTRIMNEKEYNERRKL